MTIFDADLMGLMFDKPEPHMAEEDENMAEEDENMAEEDENMAEEDENMGDEAFIVINDLIEDAYV